MTLIAMQVQENKIATLLLVITFDLVVSVLSDNWYQNRSSDHFGRGLEGRVQHPIIKM